MDKRILYSSALLGLACMTTSHAATVAAHAVRPSAGQFSGVAVDPGTGLAYERQDYGSSASAAAQLRVYADAQAFETGAVSSAVTSAVPLFGTYLAAQGGYLYARTSSQEWLPHDARLSKIDAATGMVLSTAAIADMGGTNGSDTFDWGGFSGVNAYAYGSKIAVVGGDATTNAWRVTTLDADLNPLGSFTFAADYPGFGFLIGDYLFLGDTYSSGQISHRINLATQQVAAVDYTIAIEQAGLPYWGNASYDAASDTLYLHNTSVSSFYKVAGARAAFGVAEVPEPANAWLFAAGLGALWAAFALRTRHARPHR